jgi:dienelactone hydrolase
MKLAVFLIGAFSSWLSFAEPQKISIPSLDGKLQIPGYWFAAQADGPRPAVIELHGCGGAFDSRGLLSAAYLRDAGFFNLEGIHVLALDSFSPRGLGSICEIPLKQRTVNEDDRRADVYAALQWLARQPGVDAARIAVVGRSHGGSTVLTTMNGADDMVRSQTLRPRAAVAFYPGCSRFARMRGYEPAAPTLLMIGELDDWTPAQRCVELRDKLAREHHDAGFELVVYPGSYHGFDGGALVFERRGLATKSGTAHVGGNREARQQAYRRMFDYLSAELQVPLRLSHDERFRALQ